MKILLAMSVFWLGAVARAEVLELPVDRPLAEKSRVRKMVVHLRHASVEIVVDPRADARLRARRPRRAEPEPESGVPTVEWGDEEGSILLSRRGGDAEARIPIRVEIVVAAAETIEVRGSDLDVVIRETAAVGEAAAATDGEDDPRLDLEVSRSGIRLEGISGARLAVAEGRLDLVRTTGPLSIRTAGETVEVEVEDHAGSLRLVASGGRHRLDGVRGELTLELEESRVTVTGGRGPLTARAKGGLLELEGWRGEGRFEGRSATLEVRRSGGPETDLTVEGRDLAVSVDQYEGSFTARLAGGSLRGGALSGATDLAGRSQAHVDLTGLRGEEVRLRLESGSSARLADVFERLAAEVMDSRLEAEAVVNLNLTAERSEVFATGLSRLGHAKATDSRLELDLTKIGHDPSLILRGAGTARVRLRAPCEVRLVEWGEIPHERARVSGCEFRSRFQATERLPMQTLVEGAVKLVASVSEESALVVVGTPVH